MGSFCGSGSQTVIQQATNPNVTAQQNAVYGLVNQYANEFGQNPSQLVAPWNSLQTTAAQGVADNVTAAQPWNYLGEGMIGQGANTASWAPMFYGQGATTAGNVNPLGATGWNPTPYESPFTQDVINSTMQNIQRQNQIQQTGALGNAIQSGNAFGGDRAGVTMDELARNQALAQNQTMAALQQADFNQASQQANAQQQYLLNLGLGNNAQTLQQAGLYGTLGSGLVQAGLGQGNLGYQAGNLGNLNMAGIMNAYQGLYNMGTGLQGTQQQQLSSPLTFGQWYGNASPGTQNVPTSTTYPGSSPLATIAGLGLTGLAGASLLSNLGGLGAIFANRGGRIEKDGGGGVGGSENELVGRFHKMKAALHRDMGGPAQQQNQGVPGALGMGAMPGAYAQAIIGNVPPANAMATEKAYQLRRYMQLAQQAGNQKDPAGQEAAKEMIGTQQVAHGGVIHRQDGGADDGTSIGNPYAANALNDQARNKNINDVLKGFHKILDLHKPPSPTQAPQAPGSTDWRQILGAVGGLSSLGGPSSDMTSGESRGGRTIGDMGRQHFDSGGVPYVDDATEWMTRPPEIPPVAPPAPNTDAAYLARQRRLGLQQPSADMTAGSALREPPAPVPSTGPPREMPGVSLGEERYRLPWPSAPAPRAESEEPYAPVRGTAIRSSEPQYGPSPTPRAPASSAPLDYNALIRKNMEYQDQYRRMLPALAMLKSAGGLFGRYPNGLPMNLAGISAGVDTLAQGYQSDLEGRARTVKELQEAAKTPAEIKALEARSAESQIDIKNKEAAALKELELAQMENRFKLWLKMMHEGAAGPVGRTGAGVASGLYDWGPGRLTRGE